jgi:hypothetical protein
MSIDIASARSNEKSPVNLLCQFQWQALSFPAVPMSSSLETRLYFGLDLNILSQ